MQAIINSQFTFRQWYLFHLYYRWLAGLRKEYHLDISVLGITGTRSPWLLQCKINGKLSGHIFINYTFNGKNNIFKSWESFHAEISNSLTFIKAIYIEELIRYRTKDRRFICFVQKVGKVDLPAALCM